MKFLFKWYNRKLNKDVYRVFWFHTKLEAEKYRDYINSETTIRITLLDYDPNYQRKPQAK